MVFDLINWHEFFAACSQRLAMIDKFNEATRNRPEGDRLLDAQSVFMDLNAFIRQIKNEDAWHKSDRNSITIFKTDDLCIVLGGLHQGAELPPHRAAGTMSIQVIQGELDVNTDDISTSLTKGQMIAVHKGANYRVVAAEESVYLLTICDVK